MVSRSMQFPLTLRTLQRQRSGIRSISCCNKSSQFLLLPRSVLQLPHHWHYYKRPYSASSALFADQKESSAATTTTTSATAASAPASTTDDVLLYKESQHVTVRIMFGVTCVNILYWGSQVLINSIYSGTVVQGIDLAGDPNWTAAGAFATGLMIYATTSYANHCVYRCYESADGERIGFQVHTVLGFPGSKYEARKGSVRFVSPRSAVASLRAFHSEQLTPIEAQLDALTAPPVAATTAGATGGVGGGMKAMLAAVMKTSSIPVQVDGQSTNFLFDQSGHFVDVRRFVQLLLTSNPTALQNQQQQQQQQASDSGVAAAVAFSQEQKQKRIEWMQKTIETASNNSNSNRSRRGGKRKQKQQ